MFPRDPSESSRRQKRSPSPADHSGSNSSPSREYSPPAARRRQTSRVPAKSTTHKHNFSPSRRWGVNSVDFIFFNSFSLKASFLGLTACLCVCCEYVSNTWALRLLFFPKLLHWGYLSHQKQKLWWKFLFISSSQMFFQVELQKSGMRYSQSVSIQELSSCLTFLFLESGTWKSLLPLRWEMGKVSPFWNGWSDTQVQVLHIFLENQAQLAIQGCTKLLAERGKVSYLLALEALKKIFYRSLKWIRFLILTWKSVSSGKSMFV